MPDLHLPRLQGRALARLVLGFVALAAVAGWAASFVGLHGFALVDMRGYTVLTAWLVPGSFDGAAFACSVLVYRASIFGRPALRGRVLMYAFTALSAWVNWHYQVGSLGHYVGAALPFAAVLVFDVVLTDLRAEWEERHGRKAFRLRAGLLALRWVVDRPGTWSAFRDTLMAVPVTDLVGTAALGTTTPAPRPYAGPVPAVATVTKPRPPRASPAAPVPTYDPPVPAVPDVRPVPPETDAERTTIMPIIGAKATDPGETRTKVAPVTTGRSLVSVPARLDRSAANEVLAASIAGQDLSRRDVMNRFGVGTGRATTILRLAERVS